MKTYLNSLNERERWMLIAGVICLFFYFYYMFLYAPLSNKVQQNSKILTEKMQTLDWMKQIQQKGLSTKTKKTVDNGQLLTLLATALKNEDGLHFPYQLQQTASGDIQLTFDQVPFQLFMNWLSKMNDQYNMNVKQLDIEQTGTAGVTHLMMIVSA